MAQPKRINLALQGGGAHGAFTWGALDRLLEEDRIEIAAISGTSAGALNGAALKAGLAQGSRSLARENLEWLWTQVGAITDERLSPWLDAIAPVAVSRFMESSLPFAMADSLTRSFSPYSTGPLYSNPLRRIVEKFAYDKVCAETGPELHICATNVRSGKIKIFKGHAISADAILASACLPTLFRAVEIKDETSGKLEAYWDGGYTGNPALFPLFQPHLPADVLVVNINLLYREEVPTSAREIQNRINEISFNSSLLRELRAIDFVQRLLQTGKLEQDSMKSVLVHMVSDDALMAQLSVATKTIANPHVLFQLRNAGYAACDAFLEAHFDQIGKTGSVDLREMFS